MTRVRPACALAAAALLAAAAGCSSTQSQNDKLAKENKGLAKEKGLELEGTNPRVKVLDTEVLQDQYGTAAIVVLRNVSGRDMANVPVAIDVQTKGGKTLFRNDAAGLDPALVSAPLLPSKRRVVWINNQIAAATKPGRVRVKVGESDAPVPKRLPKIVLSKIKSDSDSDGPYVKGVITNRSKILQKRLTVFCVARKGDRVVAAGRAVLEKVDPAPTKKPITFRVYFIGNPKGADIGFYAPPVKLS